MINQAITSETHVEQLAELLYLRRLIDIETQYWDADRSVKDLKTLQKKYPESFAIAKYTVRSLMQGEEF